VDGFGFLPRVGQTIIVEARAHFRERGFSNAESLQWAIARINSAPAREPEAAALEREIFSEAGVSVVIVNVSDVGEDARHALINLSAHQQFCRGTQRFGQADSVREIRELNSADKVAVVFSMNGFSPLDAPADRERFFSALDIWRSLGVRFMHLGYNNRNWFCDGCEEPTDGGLTNLGRELITSMEQIGIIPDFSHAGH